MSSYLHFRAPVEVFEVCSRHGLKKDSVLVEENYNGHKIWNKLLND